jgi:prolyl oligopeptidase PreP (S9A serine peptidase family)
MKDGVSMTDSGYPRVMREWHRGTPLSESTVVHEGETTDVAVFMHTSQHRQHSYLLKGRAITFYTSTNSIYLPGQGGEGSAEGGDWHELKVPLDSEISIYADQLLVQLRSDWVLPDKTYAQGSLLAAGVTDFVAKSTNGALFTSVLFHFHTGNSKQVINATFLFAQFSRVYGVIRALCHCVAGVVLRDEGLPGPTNTRHCKEQIHLLALSGRLLSAGGGHRE